MDKINKLPAGVIEQEYIDYITGEEKTMIIDKRKFYVYVLFYKKKPVYVGRTCNIKARINGHKASKRVFDSYHIAFDCYDDFQANITEQTLITYLKFLYPGLHNKAFVRSCGDIITFTNTEK